MKSILLFLSFELLSICQVMAQNVKGKIVDGTGKPLSFANVVLLNRQDSSFVKGTISGNDGGLGTNGERPEDVAYGASV